MQVNKITNLVFKGAKWNNNDLTTKNVLKSLSPEHKASADVLEGCLESISETYKQNVVLGFQTPKFAPNSVAIYAVIADKKYPEVRSFATIRSVNEQYLAIDGVETDYFDKFQKEAIAKMEECRQKALARNY